MARFTHSIGIQLFLDDGHPIPNGKILFEEPGTSTLKNTYADPDEQIANTNPVILSASGRQPNIWFSGLAKATLFTADNVQIEVRDNVGTDTTANAFSPYIPEVVYARNALVIASDRRYFQSIVENNLNNNPVSSPSAWQNTNFIATWNGNYSYLIDHIAIKSNLMYASLQDGNVGNDPESTPLFWRQVGDSSPDFVSGPGASVSGNFPTWSGASGTSIDDSGLDVNSFDATGTGQAAADIVQGNLDTHTADDEAHSLAKNNLTAIIDPVVTDDNTQGYSINSVWVNTLTDAVFTLANAATGAAVWTEGGGSAAYIHSITTPVDPLETPSWWDSEDGAAFQYYDNGGDPVYVQEDPALTGPIGPEGPAGAALRIQEEGGLLPARANLNFIGAGATATDDAGNDRINVTIPGGGAGDVTGPASSVNSRIVTFSGTTGKIIQDGGSLITDLATTASLAAHTGNLANPHTVTAAQAGAEAANVNIQAHIGAVTGNPHAVTAAQAGADPTGTANAAVATHVGLADPHNQYTLSSAFAVHTGDPNPHTASVGSAQESGVGALISNYIIMTQVEYDASAKNATTIYVIVG